MEPDRWEKVKELVDAAVDLHGADRREYLDSSCGSDSELRSEVERLIAAYESASGFLESPVVDFFATPQALEEGQLIAGRYRIIRRLGSGGMGEVYEAADDFLRETIALKTLKPEFVSNPSVLQRFQREIQLARKVTHPNVCRVFEAGVHEFPGTARPALQFFTMQLLDGETLAARIKRVGRLTRTDAFPIIRQMADGLQVAHQAGVVHRDFKSANVMVTGSGSDVRAVITDFGLARFRPATASADATVASTAGLAGTVGYMSPEQMMGGEITAASDIYSFGVVLYEMAAAKLPFDGRHLINSAVQRASGKIPWIRTEVPDIDSRWESAIGQCLQPEPARRFRSAAEIAEHFQVGSWRLPRLHLTRRQYIVGGGAAAMVAGLLGSYLFWVTRAYEPVPEARVWYEKGLEHLRATMFEAARRALEKSVELDPKYAPAHAYLAMAYGELDYSERAKESALHAAAAMHEHPVSASDALKVRGLQLFADHEYQQALPIFTRLSSQSTAANKASGLLELAWVARRAEQFDQALEATARAVALDSNYAAAWLLRAQLLAQRRKNVEAAEAFTKAEGLFNTASNHEGVTETLMQRGIHQARSGQSSEALSTLQRALPIAEGTKDVIHGIRLELALALAYRNIGEVEKSQEMAQRAIAKAVESGNDVWASVGLIDLGNAYYLKEEPESAERYFKQGMDFARRQKWRFHEARARLSLASLCMHYSRTVEAVDYLQSALPFFREGKYRRELLQGLTILGNAQAQHGELRDATKNVQEVLEGLKQKGDETQQAQARAALADILMKKGEWTEALSLVQAAIEHQRKAKLIGSLASSLTTRGKIFGRLGRTSEAERDFGEASVFIAGLAGAQGQTRCAVAVGQAEVDFIQQRWSGARDQARQALAEKGSEEDLLMARVIGALSETHLGKVDQALAQATTAIHDAESRSLLYTANVLRLALAETLMEAGKGDAARQAAAAALPIFETQGILEPLWRCRYLMGDLRGARIDRARMANLLRPEEEHRYAQRADVHKLVL